MREIIAFIAMSLDGYIATKNDAVDWLVGDGSDKDNFGSYPEFIEEIDTVILGYSTYHEITTNLSKDKWPYEGKMSYVLTHRNLENQEEIVFTDQPVDELMMEIRKKDGKNIWICGGANIINQFHNKGLIDRYHITVIPTILGDGIRLFAENCTGVNLKLKSTMNYNGIVDLVYEKR